MCFSKPPAPPPPPPPPVPPPAPAPTAMMVQKAPTSPEATESYKSRMSAAVRAGKSSLVIPLAGGMSGGTGIGITP